MFLIDDLLMAPVSGIKFVFRTLLNAAEQEWTDDSPVKESLLELQLKLDSGDITEEEYVAEEREILAQLREIQRRKMELAGIDPQSGPGASNPTKGGRLPMLEVSTAAEFVDHNT